jgi:hypothetical protein
LKYTKLSRIFNIFRSYNLDPLRFRVCVWEFRRVWTDKIWTPNNSGLRANGKSRHDNKKHKRENISHGNPLPIPQEGLKKKTQWATVVATST